MATAIAQPSTDSQLNQDFRTAERELREAQEQLREEEQGLANATAKFNEQCRLQAEGKKANPQPARDTMSRIEYRILGAKSVLASRQAAFDAAAVRRNEAIREQAEAAARQRDLDIQSRYDKARAAVKDAERALRLAMEEEQRAGKELRFATLGKSAAACRGRD